MKGLYMVDADRGFVQYFENLLFTNAKEYRMLGHNFKANEFLTKIKERPELLGKIDLLFVNPKLNDLNGLELVKAIQKKRSDINICIIINENIRTFFENDIAELGIENVIVYPNSDEYYINSVRNVFDKIENKDKYNKQAQVAYENKKTTISDNDLFSELNSESFLSQFDFDALSDELFKPKENKEYEPKNNIVTTKASVEEYVKEPSNYNTPETFGFNSFMANAEQEKRNESFTRKEDNGYSFNQNINNGYDSFGFNENINNSYEGFENIEREFVTPNFGFEEPNTEPDMFNSNGNSFDWNNEPKQNTYENNYDMFDNSYTEETVNSKPYENPYDNTNTKVNTDRGYNGISDSPLDLSAFGVGNGTSNNSFSMNTGNTSFPINKPEMSYGNRYEEKPIENDMFMPYEETQGTQKSNLQSINRPDIDNSSTFNAYEQKDFGMNQFNYPRNNSSDRYNDTNDSDNFGWGNQNRVQHTVNNQVNPYEEYSRHKNMAEKTKTTPFVEFSSYEPTGYINNQSNFDVQDNQYRGNNFGVQGNKYQENSKQDNWYNNAFEKKESNYNEYGNNQHKPSIEQLSKPTTERSFGGFDFSKPYEEKDNNQGTSYGSTKLNGSENSYGFSENYGGKQKESYNSSFSNDNFGMNNDSANNYNQNSYDRGNVGSRDMIENMYNSTKVNDLNYAPSYDYNMEQNGPVVHERNNNDVYRHVPAFAKQIVAFYSTKGGIGKTSLAVNATIQLAKYSKKKICLIDFDVTNANVHTHLGILDSMYDLSVISNFESEIDSFSLSRIVTPYRVKDKNGDTVEFDVIVGFKEMKMSQRFNEKEVDKILSILEEMYDIVVVDTHPVYTDLAVSTILKKSTKIVFVTEQDMTALNGAKDFILASKRYGIPSEKLFMVLNRYKSNVSIFTKNAIEKSLNKKIMATVPSDMDTLRDSVNTNNPVSIDRPDSELARAYIDIARVIDTKLIVPEEPKGFFKKFKR